MNTLRTPILPLSQRFGDTVRQLQNTLSENEFFRRMRRDREFATEKEIEVDVFETARDHNRYPVALIVEYRRLAMKELLNPLSDTEKTRLQEIMDEIDEIDRQHPSTQVMNESLQRLDTRLDEIGLKIERLIANQTEQK